MHVVVTGATGFVGRHVLAALRRRGDEVTAVVAPRQRLPAGPGAHGIAELRADLLDPGLRLPERCDAVVHLAAMANPREAAGAPAAALQANVAATLNVLEAAPAGARFVLASTGQVYAPSEHPLTEESPVDPPNWYAATKLMAEWAVRQRARERGLDWCIARIFNLYGPGQRDDYVVASIAAQAAQGRVPEVRDPRPVRDFTYVTDAADFLALCASLPQAAGQVYNLASGQAVAIGDVVRLACDVAGLSQPPAAPAPHANDAADAVRADPAKARMHLGWSASTPLREGLAATLRAAREVVA